MASKLSNYSVRAKVMLAFALVLTATIGLGVFSALRLMEVKTQVVAFSDDWLPGIRDIGDLKFMAMRYRQRQAVYLLLTTDAERAKEQANLLKIRGEFEAVLTRFSAASGTEEEKTTASNIRQSWDAYIEHEPAMFALIASSGQPAAASDYAHSAKALHDVLKTHLENASKHHMDGGVLSGETAKAAVSSGLVLILAGLGAAIALCFTAGLVLIRSVSIPLVNITQAMGELAAGHLDTNVPHADQQDEIGKLADAMTAFKNQLAEAEQTKLEQTRLIVSSIGTGLDHLAKGDLTHRVTVQLTGAFAKLKDDFNLAMTRLQDTVKNVLGSAHQIASGASEISIAADSLSRRTEQQAAALEETAAALEEITATVKTTAGNAKEASRSVEGAKQAAENGGRVVETAVRAMDAIAQSSKQITDITGVIDEIAFQTNLLALNAGVEAARAGEAGRGFAVVASEVRALAQRSGEAAKQIKTLINTSSAHVGDGVKFVGETGQALKNIVDQVLQINSLVGEMALAAEQQSSGIEEVNGAVTQMDQVTQQNAAMVEESTAASRGLAHETEALNTMVRFFKVGEEAMAPTAPRAPSPPKPRPQPVRGGALARKIEASPDTEWDEF